MQPRSTTGDWTATTVDEVAPQVFRIPLPLPNDALRAVNVYALLSPDGVALIDSGWAIREARDLLARGLGTLGADLGDVHRYFVTHVHRDHYTLALELRREFQGRVWLGIGERPDLEKLSDPAHHPMTAQIAALRRCGAVVLADQIEASVATDGARERLTWEMPDEWLRDGDRVTHGARDMDVIETPGHTAGHVVFHDVAERLLFAGDHVLPTITPSINVAAVLAEDPLTDFLRSLAIVRARPDALLLPAHGPVAASVHARIDELVDHHGRRLDETATAVVARGARTAYEAATHLRWTKRGRTLEELDNFNRMLAVLETEAHLVLLVAQGRLTSDAASGVTTYGEA
jgi:glyoxylase-like metal-dependent hydrolase (beta-lactamase superfamily II)